METIQVVIDRDLLRAADRAARKSKMNRSELIRLALREHLKHLEALALEQRDRLGYEKYPAVDVGLDWELEAVWPSQ